MIKIHTFLKGLIWELIGMVLLFSYLWYQTNDFNHAIGTGLAYPFIRVLLWYPYERLFKYLRRRKNKSEVNRVRSNGSVSQDTYVQDQLDYYNRKIEQLTKNEPLNIYGDTE